MSKRTLHHSAWETARELVRLIGHNYREEEHRDLLEEFATVIRRGFESYCLQLEDAPKRKSPSQHPE